MTYFLYKDTIQLSLFCSALVNSQTLMEESAKFEKTCNDIKKKEKRPLLWKLRKAVRTVKFKDHF